MEKSLIKPFIAKRVAQEFTDGMVVNLGIGLPVLCTNYLPEGIHVTVHSELGIVGQGPAPDAEHADPMHIVDAGGSPSSVVLGGAFTDSSDSFALIRGGHVDAVVLGGLEVDEEGPKILKKCRLPYAAVHCVNMIVTEMGVMNVTDKGLELIEYNPEFTLEQIIAATEADLIIGPELKKMDMTGFEA